MTDKISENLKNLINKIPCNVFFHLYANYINGETVHVNWMYMA